LIYPHLQIPTFLHATAETAITRLSHGNSVCLSVSPSVRHTGESVNNRASWDHQIFTVGCLKNSSFRIGNASASRL